MQSLPNMRIGAYEVVTLNGQDETVSGLLAACQDFFVHHHLGEGQTPSIDYLMQDLSEAQKAGSWMLGLRDEHQSLIGLVLLVKDWQRPRQWCLRVQILHPAHRGQGLGAKLYHAVMTWAKAQGAAAMLIGVLTSNDGALRFWKRLGFQEVSRSTHSSGGELIDLEHRFCDLPIDRVVSLGSTLARQWQQREANPFGGIETAAEPRLPVFGQRPRS